MTVARPRTLLLAAAIVASCSYLLFLGRHTSFFQDEWVFILQRPLTDLDSWLRPHNGHFSAALVLVWRGLFELVGLHSYLPYLTVLLMIHGLAAAGVIRLMSEIGGWVLATYGALVFLLLGSAYEDLFWSFQAGFVGSVAAGSWALVLLGAESPRRWLAAGLLVVSIASSGMGLAFLVAAGVQVAFGPRPRALIASVLVPAGIYVLWYALYGRATTDPSGFGVDNLIKMPLWVETGAGRAAAGLTGLGDEIGTILVLGVIGAALLGLVRERPDLAPREVRASAVAAGAAAGIVTEFLLIGLARGPLEPGVTAALAPRYMYASSALLLVAIAALLGQSPNRGAAIRRAAALAPLFALAYLSNVNALYVSGVPYFEARAQELRSAIDILERYANAPAVVNGHFAIAPPNVLEDLFRARGDPTRDVLYRNAVQAPNAAAYDRSLFSIVEESFAVEEVGSTPPGSTPVRVLGTHILTATDEMTCTALHSDQPVDSQVWFAAVSGSSYVLVPDVGGEVQFYLSHLAEPQEPDSIRISTGAGAQYVIRVPDMGPGFEWTLRIKFPNGVPGARLCRLP